MRSFGGTHVKYGGLIVAAIGFTLTRYTVAESAQFMGPFVEFVAAKGVFLLVGLAITVIGVALSVSTYDETSVSIIAWWTVIGVGTMAFVIALTVLSSPGALTDRETHLVANVLLGSAVGGLLTGFRSASRYRQRHLLTSQADRLTTLNRILRHEVLNKVNVIRGYANLTTDGGVQRKKDSLAVIERSAVGIDEAIEQVGVIAQTEIGSDAVGEVDVNATVRRVVSAVEDRYPTATVRVDIDDGVVACARADDTLDVVVDHLLTNAIEHADRPSPSVTVSVTADETDVHLAVRDEGPGLPPAQQELLDGGSLPEYDDPTAGFGLTIVRLLTNHLGAGVEVTVEAGTTVRVTLPRAELAQQVGVRPTVLARVGVVALLAGVAMGVVFQTTSGAIGVIGSLYGVASQPVGWATHLFHSVVFGMVFVALHSHPWTERLHRQVGRPVTAATLFGLGLWVVAAGVMMPLWLRLLGLEAPFPNLDAVGLVGHLVWGLVLGVGVEALEARE